jgi:hypothetical protein
VFAVLTASAGTAAGAVSGATGAAASASQQAGAAAPASTASTTAASTTAGASTFFSHPTRAKAATSKNKPVNEFIIFFLLCGKFPSAHLIYNSTQQVYTK